MVWNTGLCLARWGQPPPPGFAPSWSPVKINPVLAKPRTDGLAPRGKILTFEAVSRLCASYLTLLFLHSLFGPEDTKLML